MNHPFGDEDLLVIFESAFQTLNRDATRDLLGYALDINDEELERVRLLLENFLKDKPQPEYLKEL
jgi:hypothetical protein